MGVVVCRLSDFNTHTSPSDNLPNFNKKLGLLLWARFVSIYIYIYLFYAFSPLMSLCWGWKPHPTHMGKKYKKKEEKECIRMQYEEHTNKLFLSTIIDKPKWIENNPKGFVPSCLLLPLWALDATLLFPDTKTYPIPLHFPLLRIYFSLRSTSVGYHPQELKKLPNNIANSIGRNILFRYLKKKNH
jgi:hypothetical protein